MIESKSKRIASICLFLVLTLTILYGITFVLRPKDTDQCIKAVEAFHSIPDNTAEVMIYGSSHAWRGVDPLTMYEKYGIGSYNYGANWQNISTESLFFYDSLRSQKPKVVLIETFLINNTFRDTDLCGEIYYTRAIKGLDKRKEYLHNAFGRNIGRYFSYYFPLSQFHSSWNAINKDNFVVYYDKDEFVNTMGFYYMPIDEILHYEVELTDPDTFTQIELVDEAIEALDGIVDTCKELGIEVVFFTTPFEGEYLFMDAMEEYASSRECTYLNMFRSVDEIGINPETDFADVDHFTVAGARKISEYLGKYLSDNYELTDMRETKDNLWEGKYGNRVGYKWIEYHPEVFDRVN